MQKFAFILTLLFTCHVMASAQNLTKAEVDELMNQAIEWNKAGSATSIQLPDSVVEAGELLN